MAQDWSWSAARRNTLPCTSGYRPAQNNPCWFDAGASNEMPVAQAIEGIELAVSSPCDWGLACGRPLNSRRTDRNQTPSCRGRLRRDHSLRRAKERHARRLRLAFFWHQHQPYYPDDVGQENPMPWVRLHGTKDYWGMAMLLKEVPELHGHDQPGSQPAGAVVGLHRTRATRTRICAVSRLPGRRPQRGGPELPAGQFLHGPSGPDDPALTRATTSCIRSAACRSIRRSGPASGSARRTSSTCNAGRTWRGSIRWPSSRTPSWPSSATRAATGREDEKQWLLDKQMELLAAGGAAAPRAAGAGADRS